jgi:YHS domain-containing protein
MPQTSTHQHNHGPHHGHGRAAADLVTDPVCGMTVDPPKSTRKVEHEGNVFYFCSDRCRQKFHADPAHYLEPVAEPPLVPGLEIAAFGSGHLSRSIVPFSWGRKWRNVSAGKRFRRN